MIRSHLFPGVLVQRLLGAGLAAVVVAACAAPGGGSGDGAPGPRLGPGLGSVPGDASLSAPCPATPALEDLHTALWQLERAHDRTEPEERAARARQEIEAGGAAPGWADLAASIEHAGQTDVPFSAIEELRARLHESSCLGPELHRELHRNLDDPLQWEPIDLAHGV